MWKPRLLRLTACWEPMILLFQSGVKTSGKGFEVSSRARLSPKHLYTALGAFREKGRMKILKIRGRSREREPKLLCGRWPTMDGYPVHAGPPVFACAWGKETRKKGKSRWVVYCQILEQWLEQGRLMNRHTNAEQQGRKTRERMKDMGDSVTQPLIHVLPIASHRVLWPWWLTPSPFRCHYCLHLTKDASNIQSKL